MTTCRCWWRSRVECPSALDLEIAPLAREGRVALEEDLPRNAPEVCALFLVDQDRNGFPGKVFATRESVSMGNLI